MNNVRYSRWYVIDIQTLKDAVQISNTHFCQTQSSELEQNTRMKAMQQITYILYDVRRSTSLDSAVNAKYQIDIVQ